MPAFLAVTDLTVSVTFQPVNVMFEIYLLDGINAQNVNDVCNINGIVGNMFDVLIGECVFHLVSLERYFAIKHAFFYDNHISGADIVITSGIAWVIILTSTVLRSIDIYLQIIALEVDDF